MLCVPTASSAASVAPAERVAATFATTSLSAPALAFTGPVAWGENHYGQLGDGKSGSENNSDVPVALSGVGEVVALAGGKTHSLALLANGTVMSWGENSAGQLGDGKSPSEQPQSDVPVAVSGLSEVGAIAAGGDFSLALLKNGTVMSWGSDEGGRLGNGKSGEANDSDVPVPVSGLSEVTAISAGDGHSLALLKNGTVMSWGRNEHGELGTGSSTGPETKPVAVSSLSGVASIAAAGEHSLAVLGSGAVMAWGANGFGQLGTGSFAGPETCEAESCATKPVAVTGLTEASAAAGGKYFSVALQKSGAVVTWGDNSSGELGDGVSGGPERCSGNVQCSTKPVPVSGLTEAAAISAGGGSGFARLKAGAVAAWGLAGAGELGNGAKGSSTCEECSRTPVHVDGLSGTTALSAGGAHALALGTLAPIPTITSVEPNDGPAGGGTSLTITGANLSEVTAVKFGSANATSFKVESETKISATSPPGAGVVDVTVATANATSPIASADHFDYAPTVTHVEPNDGAAAGGTSVTITGTNFNEVSAVKFGSTNATSFKVESAGKIAAVAPGGTGSVDVTVTSAGGTSPTGASDVFDYAPTVTKIEPRQGPATGGTSVTITGTNFNEVSAVKFGSNTAASVTVNSPTSITAHSPAGSGTVDVTVTTAGGTSPTSEADRFTYGPEVTAVSPGYGSPGGGTSVTITGSRFSGATAVKFGSANATSFKVESATSITAVSPSGTGTVDVTVTTPEGTSASSTADSFNYGPTVTKLEPINGPNAGGTSVQVIGTNFNEVEAVKFGSTNVSFTRNSETSITIVSPPFPGGSARVRVSVTTRGGVSPERISTILGPEYFGYGPIVTSVSPKSGPAAGGTSVTIEGKAFESIRQSDEFPIFVKSVKFGSTNATSFEVHPAGEEASVTAVAPVGSGTVDVTVETGAGTSPTSSADRFSYTARQAGHYYSNGLKIAEGASKAVIGWGTLTIAGVKGGTLPNHVTCRYAAPGTVENPLGGGAGVGSTLVFVAWACDREHVCAAPDLVGVTAEKIVQSGWPSVLTEPEVGKWRPEISKVKLDIGCFNPANKEERVGGTHITELGGFGTETPGVGWKPETHKGTNAAHPGGVVFGEGSGELECEGCGGAITLKTEGELKTFGYLNQELINVKE